MLGVTLIDDRLFFVCYTTAELNILQCSLITQCYVSYTSMIHGVGQGEVAYTGCVSHV